MQSPTSDAHSNTCSINANFEGISNLAGVVVMGEIEAPRNTPRSLLQTSQDFRTVWLQVFGPGTAARSEVIADACAVALARAHTQADC